ncbi:hypothetical protein SLH49_08450 [Cognatiyoonia sp. IB215446]|uniref:hypothetical protein n=1 Tax=Cognatiyoonia sp. IB215446 TaxID=3097355 RepID=UPI002A10AB7F|nr:hypothetical protein [Cognatiyoonia sp. IB215446]MDX8348014.1 hypothetical protein [Cognatiyoonia sp. IB215446]
MERPVAAAPDGSAAQSRMISQIHRLGTVKAPAPTFGTRAAPPGSTIHDPAFWERYDTDTLIYDSVWRPERRLLSLYLPKMFNFETVLQRCTFRLGTKNIAPKRSKYIRFDRLDFKAEPTGLPFQLETPGGALDLPVHDAAAGRFAGKNVIYTMVRNDDLIWIRDWVLAHQRNHGADAVLIANNGSTEYDSATLAQAISDVPGIVVADVLDVPLRHGPAPKSVSGVGFAKFLQTACLNLVRDRFFEQARAVLLCDVDELVTAPEGHSIFDATARSFTKYRPIGGSWRFAAEKDGLLRHADHVLGDETNHPCADKYCIVPDSFFGRMGWSVHSLENVNRRIFRPRGSFRFYHCRGISTSWKGPRKGHSARAGPPDLATQDFMTKTFAKA